MTEFPSLSSGVVLHPPLPGSTHWFVERGRRDPLRIGADAGRLLELLDGRTGADELAGRLGSGWSPTVVANLLARFSALELLDDVGTRSLVRDRRLTFRAPAMIQLRLLRGASVVAPFRGMLERLNGSAVFGAALTLGVLGPFALALAPAALVRAVGEPQPISALLLVWVGLIATTAVHELSHGGTLAHFGGRPGWLGVMLFYLSPACFCEITESWRLENPRQRVMVALAGIVANMSVGGLAAFAALITPDGEAHSVLILFSLTCYLTGLFNLLPVVRLDGYIALMAYLDLPHLRDRAMADARSLWLRLLFGVRRPRELPGVRWAVPFGILCALVPVALLGTAVLSIARSLLMLGPVGAFLLLALVTFLLVRLVLVVVRALSEAHRGGARTVRIVSGVAVAAISAAVLLTLVPVPSSVWLGYVNDGNGVRLVLPAGTYLDAVRAGSPVTLERRGILVGSGVGTGRVGQGLPHQELVPLSSTLPVVADGLVPAAVLSLDDVVNVGIGRYGTAHLVEPPISLGRWVAERYWLPAWDALFEPEVNATASPSAAR